MWEYSSRQVWVVLCVSMQLGQKTNHTYLSNPSVTACEQTHIRTQEHIHTQILNMETPQRRDLLDTELHVFTLLLL